MLLLAFALLKTKTEPLYVKLFKTIKSAIYTNLKINKTEKLAFASFHSDFEKDISNAFKRVLDKKIYFLLLSFCGFSKEIFKRRVWMKL